MGYNCCSSSVTVPEPTTTNKGKALVSTGTGIEFADFNSGVSTGFKVYKSGSSFEEVTTNTAVLFDQTTTNVGAGNYSTTSGTYRVPVTGYYNIFANFTFPSGIDYRIQKSTNSGTSYTDLATSSDKPTTSIVESLNQNDLIRVISGDGSTGSTLNFQQGSTKNSFEHIY